MSPDAARRGPQRRRGCARGYRQDTHRATRPARRAGGRRHGVDRRDAVGAGSAPRRGRSVAAGRRGRAGRTDRALPRGAPHARTARRPDIRSSSRSTMPTSSTRCRRPCCTTWSLRPASASSLRSAPANQWRTRSPHCGAMAPRSGSTSSRSAPEDVATLLRAVLDGEIDAASARRLWQITGGNPLYLHEIVDEAVRAGTLELVHGVWHWHGDVRVGARLRELVELRLAGLDDEERARRVAARRRRCAAARGRRPRRNPAGGLAFAAPGLRGDRSPAGTNGSRRSTTRCSRRSCGRRCLRASARVGAGSSRSRRIRRRPTTFPCSNGPCGWSTVAWPPTEHS